MICCLVYKVDFKKSSRTKDIVVVFFVFFVFVFFLAGGSGW